MVDVAVPSIAVATAASGDTVLGVKGGAVKRMGAGPSFEQLAADAGADLVGFQQFGTGAVARTVQEKARDSVTPADFAAYPDADNNTAAYSAYLTARSNPQQVVESPQSWPKLSLVSQAQIGKQSQAFPSAVRYAGYDYILYREGTGHLQSVPFTTVSRLTVAKRNVVTGVVEEHHVIRNVSGTDPRDPNVLRDNLGNAILVGGKFKVVMFEWVADYTAGSGRAVAFDLDPANLAAGLTGGVELPAPVEAVKSDVRLLSSGAYAFVGYSTGNTCYLVTTTDWLTFTTELIGPGNECALAETADGALNVIARADTNFGRRSTIFYKKPVAGSWRVHAVLPFTLNAPTLLRCSDGFVQSAAPGGTGFNGWLLLGREKHNRTDLSNDSTPSADLVAYYSKDAGATSINEFQTRTVIMGGTVVGKAETGDSHYCSAIIDSESGKLAIYTYATFNPRRLHFTTSMGTLIFALNATLAAVGVQVERHLRRNTIKNGDLRQGKFGWDIRGTNATLETVNGGSELKVVNSITSPATITRVRVGQTYFPSIVIRTASTDRSDARHVDVKLYEYITGAWVIVGTLSPAVGSAALSGTYHRVVGAPMVFGTDKVLITISHVGAPTAESYIKEVVLSDSYDEMPVVTEGHAPIVIIKSGTISIAGGGGAVTGSGTYSSSFWTGVVGIDITAAGLPYLCDGADSISLRLEDCTSYTGTVPLLPYKLVINADGSIGASFFSHTAAGNVGPTVAYRAEVTLAPKVTY